MIKNILTAAGLVEYETFRRSRFPAPPAGSYAVYFDDVETDGSDFENLLKIHNYTVELYESAPDDALEEAIEAALDAQGIRWTKQDRYWLQEEQRYQVIYEFEYIEKRR